MRRWLWLWLPDRLASLALVLLAIALGACAGILGLKSRARSPEHRFEHHEHLVAGVNCLQCHESIKDAKGGGEGDATLHLPSTATCVSCHAKPHETRACNECHGVGETREAAAAAAHFLRFEHQRHLPAVKGQCVPCHSEAGARDPSTMRPAMAQCFTCHQHEKQWASRDCAGCHRDLPSEKVKPSSHVVHDGDWLREHGVRAAAARDLCATCHSESSCAECHGVSTAALPWKLKIEDMKLDRLHAGNFMARHPDEARAQPGLCSTCHSESFCVECHTAKKVSAVGGGAALNPHPPGWVRAVGGDHGRAARLDPLACASCHGGAGEMLCVGCHKVGGAGGNPHGPGFASTRDKVKDVPCKLCHAS